MRITHEHHFAATVDEVSAMLADPVFARERGEAAGAASADVSVDGTVGDGFTIALRQAVPASSIPQEFRSFVGSDLTVRYTEVWEPAAGEERTATFAVEIVGAPGHASGSLGISPTEAGATLWADGSVNVRVPLVGPMIERAVGQAVLKGLEDQLAAADAWLARS